MTSHRFGQLGEEYAARYLWKKKYTVISNDRKKRLGEIDLIAIKGRNLVFAEVKTRKPQTAALPREAVDREKQRKIINASLLIMSDRKDLKNYQPRYDVIEVIMEEDTDFRRAHINHIENAFNAEGMNALF